MVHHRVAATICQPPGFFGRCGRGNDLAAYRSDAVQQARLGQPKVKAGHFWPERPHDLACRLAERRAIRGGDRLAPINTEFDIVRAEALFPSRLACGVGHGRRVREKIQVHRLGRALPDDAKHRTDLIGYRQGAGKGTKSALPH